MATPIPPPLGQVQPGELYVDLQTRQLWLGVAESVSEDRAVLISNITGSAELAAEVLLQANTYTADQVASRSPVGHKHVSTDITDFNPAVDARLAASPSAAKFERGMVMMYSGLLTDIGVGRLAGWALCDGSTHNVPALPPATGMVQITTPNLRDKFVVGAGNKLIGAGPAADGILISGGTHVHTINPTVLSVAQLPSHNHGGATGTENVNHTHSVNIATDAQGQHQHNGLQVIGSSSDSGGEAGPYITTQNSGNIGLQNNAGITALGGIHSHNVIGNTGAPNVNHTHSIASVGSDQGHAHTITGGGGIHEHPVSSAQLREGMAYLALAYIMKL